MRRLAATLGGASALLVLVTFSLRAQQRGPGIPRPRLPPPVPPELLRPSMQPVRLTLTDLRFVTTLGHRVHVPRVELVVAASAGPSATRPIHVPIVRVIGLEVLVPPDTVTTGLPLFVEVPVPRLSIDRIIVEDANFSALAHPSQYEGRWLWRMRDLDLELRDVQLGGVGPESLRLARLDFAGDIRGRPLAVTSMNARARRTETRFEFEGRTTLGESRLTFGGVAHRAGQYRVTADADPVVFADVQAVAPRLPERGVMSFAARIEHDLRSTLLALQRATARIGDGALTARGMVRTGEQGLVDDVAIDIREVAARDLGEMLGVGLDGAEPWSGRITADGSLRDGITADATASGPMWLSANLRSTGPADALRIDGSVAARSAAKHRIAANGSSDSAAARSAWSDAVVARIEGVVGVTGERAVDARVLVDSIPLRLLPLPAALDSVRGGARAELRVTGTLGEPLFDGRIDLRDGAFRVRSANLEVTELGGPIRIDNRIVTIDALRGRLNEGSLALAGTVAVAEPRTLDVRLTAGGVRLLGNDSAHVLAFGEVHATGPVSRPVAEAETRVVSGRRRPAGVDASVLSAAPDTVLLAIARGNATLARGGELSATVRVDSLPLGALPTPAGLRDVRGSARGDFRVSGTLARPRVDGELTFRDAGLRVARTGTTVEQLNGSLRVEDGVAATDGVHARAGAGTVALEGNARFSGDGRGLDLRVSADSATVLRTDSATLVASARLAATGPFDLPMVSGAVRLLDGRVHEDNFKREPPIDVEEPPYSDLMGRVPWINESRLRAPAAATAERLPDDGPPFRGRVVVDITPGVKLYDEDSEMYGTGRLLIVADSTAVTTNGLYRIEGGYYAQYGEVLRVAGGVFNFSGTAFAPRVTLRSEHVLGRPIGTGLANGIRPLEDSPPIESFAIGSTSGLSEEARRLSLLPESKTELGPVLLYGLEPEPITGLRIDPFWSPDAGADLIGERAETQSVALLWGYVANESYDYLPLTKGYFRAGVLSVGSVFPGRVVVGPYMSAAARLGPLEALLTQPLAGGSPPGVRLRWRAGAAELMLFEEPLFFSALAVGGGRGFDVRRRGGVGVRWQANY